MPFFDKIYSKKLEYLHRGEFKSLRKLPASDFKSNSVKGKMYYLFSKNCSLSSQIHLNKLTDVIILIVLKSRHMFTIHHLPFSLFLFRHRRSTNYFSLKPFCCNNSVGFVPFFFAAAAAAPK